VSAAASAATARAAAMRPAALHGFVWCVVGVMVMTRPPSSGARGCGMASDIEVGPKGVGFVRDPRAEAVEPSSNRHAVTRARLAIVARLLSAWL
jgi:hypothetical protein